MMSEPETQDVAGGGAGASSFAKTFSAQSIASLQKDTTAFTKAVDSGNLRISENGAKHLQKALSNMQDRLDGMRWHLNKLEEMPELGGHRYGQIVAQHNYRTAAGDPDSALNMVQQLRQVLVDASEALTTAIDKHRAHEEQAADTFSGEL